MWHDLKRCLKVSQLKSLKLLDKMNLNSDWYSLMSHQCMEVASVSVFQLKVFISMACSFHSYCATREEYYIIQQSSLLERLNLEVAFLCPGFESETLVRLTACGCLLTGIADEILAVPLLEGAIEEPGVLFRAPPLMLAWSGSCAWWRGLFWIGSWDFWCADVVLLKKMDRNDFAPSCESLLFSRLMVEPDPSTRLGTGKIISSLSTLSCNTGSMPNCNMLFAKYE